MAQTYLLFDFGPDEAKVQQARHKLDSWRQAFRLDKKLQFKFDRGEAASAAEAPAEAEKPAPAASKSKAPKGKSRTKADNNPESSSNGDVKLMVRLYFSPHEKLSEQRWIDRIPTEEPFKGAAPKIVKEGSPEFSDVLTRFDTLD